MGTKNINTRRSQRINNRWVTLATGFSPSHPYHKDRPQLSQDCKYRVADSYAQSLLNIVEGDYADISSDISADISLQRDSVFNDLSNRIADLSISMSHEERFNTIESEVSALKTDVGTINGKLDRLIESMAALTTNDTVSAPAIEEPGDGGSATDTPAPSHVKPSNARPPQLHTTTPHTRHAGTSNVHHAVDRHLSREEFLQREMDRDKFEFAANGRYQYSNDFSSARVMAKPYMYLSRDGLFSVKHKLEARQSITSLEYVDATLALLADRRAFDNRDYNDIMHHLRKVTRDALERPWPAVRRWSQFVWDSIEAGDICWADRDEIQEERVRLCLTSTVSSHQNNVSNVKKHNANAEVICRDYNSRHGCRHREGHGDAHVFYTHCCSYCDSVGKVCFHSVRECERRVTHARNDNGYQQGRARHQVNFNGHANGAQNSFAQQHQPHQFSKNGF